MISRPIATAALSATSRQAAVRRDVTARKSAAVKRGRGARSSYVRADETKAALASACHIRIRRGLAALKPPRAKAKPIVYRQSAALIADPVSHSRVASMTGQATKRRDAAPAYRIFRRAKRSAM